MSKRASPPIASVAFEHHLAHSPDAVKEAFALLLEQKPSLEECVAIHRVICSSIEMHVSENDPDNANWAAYAYESYVRTVLKDALTANVMTDLRVRSLFNPTDLDPSWSSDKETGNGGN